MKNANYITAQNGMNYLYAIVPTRHKRVFALRINSMALKNEDFCDCNECESAIIPCARDCEEDSDSECEGCKQFRENKSGAV